ncbi:preprotein translocase subunit SecY, partial [candidate division WOR-3 bacterium]|nr:preprotein translocase subunit SecY [candidate division WOR-3 bacterium]
MIRTIQNIFKIPDLRKKLLFTLFIFFIYRLGGHVPLPGIDIAALTSWFAGQAKGILGLYDIFAGGNVSRATIFALGIMPYISASIIMQLLSAVLPLLQKLQHEGEEGRKKITQYTRYMTILLAVVQGYAISILLEGLAPGGVHVVVSPGLPFRLVTVLTLTAGTVFVMWLGEKITEHGIGNGISMIILVGIIARTPNDVINITRQLLAGTIGITAVAF